MRITLPAIFFLVCSTALAQTATPLWELGGNYQYERADIGGVQNLATAFTNFAHLPSLGVPHDLNTNGFNVSAQENKANWWGGIVEVGGSYSTLHVNLSSVTPYLGLVPLSAKVQPTMYTVSSGPQFTYRKNPKMQPFLRVMGGIAHADLRPDAATKAALNSYVPAFKTTNNSFALTGGVGADYIVNSRFTFRAAGDYQRTWLFTQHQSNVRLLAGFTFRLGSR